MQLGGAFDIQYLIKNILKLTRTGENTMQNHSNQKEEKVINEMLTIFSSW